MKKLLIGIAIGALAVLSFTAVPTLAQADQDESEAIVSDQENWNDMYEACQEGDWDGCGMMSW